MIGYGYYNLHTKHSEVEVDYSPYLGPDWRKNKFQGKRVSKLISNHQGFLEILTWISLLTPVVDFYIKALNSLYLDRKQEPTKERAKQDCGSNWVATKLD